MCTIKPQINEFVMYADAHIIKIIKPTHNEEGIITDKHYNYIWAAEDGQLFFFLLRDVDKLLTKSLSVHVV